jgi:hypothetical protein
MADEDGRGNAGAWKRNRVGHGRGNAGAWKRNRVGHGRDGPRPTGRAIPPAGRAEPPNLDRGQIIHE